MPASKSALAYIRKYNDTHYDRINLTVPKGTRDTIKARAFSLGKSVNEYISGLIVVDLCGGTQNEQQNRGNNTHDDHAGMHG